MINTDDIPMGRMDDENLCRLVDHEAAHCLSGRSPVNIPAPVFVNLEHAGVRARRRNWSSAISQLLTDANPAARPPRWRINYAQLVARCGDIERALDIILNAYDEDSSLIDGFARLGGLRMIEGYWREAEELMRRDIRLERISWQWKLKYAEVLDETCKIDAAHEMVSAVYADVPEAVDGHAFIARMYARRKDWARVYAQTKKDNELKRMSPAGRVMYAQAAACCGDLDHALSQIASAYRQDRSITDAHACAAWEAFRDSRRYTDMIAWMERDLEYDRLSPEWRLRLSQTYAASGNRPKARESLRNHSGCDRDVMTCYDRMAAVSASNTGIEALISPLMPTGNPAEHDLIEALRRECSLNASKRNAVIFGAGSSGVRNFREINGWYNVIGFCDNEKSKHGGVLLDLPVLDPQAVQSLAYDRIVVCSMYEEDIVRQLTDDLKLPPDKVETFGLPFTLDFLNMVAEAASNPDVSLRFIEQVIETVLSFIRSYDHIKNNRYALKMISNYIARGLARRRSRQVSRKNGKRRILICCDRIKAGFHDTHALIYSAIGAQLAKAGNAEVHILATHENQVIPDNEYEHPYRSPLNESWVSTLIRRYIPEQFGKNVFLRYFNETGLKGLADVCNAILDLEPDAVLYASGKLYWNECPIVRHSLFDFLPTAFFFVQCGDRVDEANDVIIARGKHIITGNPGNARIMEQAYPIITKLMSPSERSEHDARRNLSGGRRIVSGLTGKRMEAVLGAMSDRAMESLMRVLTDTRDTLWDFIGALDPAAVERVHPLIEKHAQTKRIRVLPMLNASEFEVAIAESYLFLHPPGFTGGARGAHIARRYGIPVLCFNSSDPAGLQPPMTVFDDGHIDEFADYAVRLLTDPSEYLAVVNAQDRLVAEICDTAGRGFYQCVETAIARFEQRKENRHE